MLRSALQRGMRQHDGGATGGAAWRQRVVVCRPVAGAAEPQHGDVAVVVAGAVAPLTPPTPVSFGGVCLCLCLFRMWVVACWGCMRLLFSSALHKLGSL